MSEAVIAVRVASVVMAALATVMSALGATWPVFLGWTLGLTLITAFHIVWDRKIRWKPDEHRR
jgi:xanthine/uracil/vitamin C permease (AzgA family)